jgi:streptomycin 6-kinase
MGSFKNTIINLYGKIGKDWLVDLPKLVNEIALKWNLSDLQPVDNLTYNYVLFGMQDKRPIVLKLGLDAIGIKREAVALKTFAGYGAVQLLAHMDNILLLERAIPGKTLKIYWPDRDNQAIEIVSGIMHKLYAASLPTNNNFPTIIDWLTALDREIEIPNKYLEKARVLRNNLLNTCANFKFLHGDLHHYNILQYQDDWAIIDPKGVLGEPAYEVAAFIRNPIPELLDYQYAMDIIINRITCFAHILSLDERRIINWCFVQAVLTWIWNLEDGLSTAYSQHLTRFFDKLTSLTPH